MPCTIERCIQIRHITVAATCCACCEASAGHVKKKFKGVVFALQGWYWPYLGPANTMYVPGPLLKACNNEILLLEVGTQKAADAKATGMQQSTVHGHTPCLLTTNAGCAACIDNIVGITEV